MKSFALHAFFTLTKHWRSRWATGKIEPMNRLVIVAALGYFVDIFDLMLFSIYRGPSLRELGLDGPELVTHSLRIMNFQMAGLLIGGFAWGILGDRIGRAKTLFGSILIYSVVTLLNSWVSSPEQYAWFRFFAGLGLAGELGTGVTLIVESMPATKRGIGTFVMAGFGLSGAIFAGLSAEFLSWRSGYMWGGILGLLLLLLRMTTLESPLFKKFLQAPPKNRRQSHEIWKLISNPARLGLYFRCVGMGVPIWFVGGVLILLAPEIGGLLGVQGEVKGNQAVMISYIGVVMGDVLSGLMSQLTRSRKKPIAIFMVITFLAAIAYLVLPGFGVKSLDGFYTLMMITGVGTGFWVLCMTMASESFGTNVRATVSTSLPNVVRGSVIPINFGMQFLREPLGLVGACAVVGGVCFALGFYSLWSLKETWGKELDFIET